MSVALEKANMPGDETAGGHLYSIISNSCRLWDQNKGMQSWEITPWYLPWTHLPTVSNLTNTAKFCWSMVEYTRKAQVLLVLALDIVRFPSMGLGCLYVPPIKLPILGGKNHQRAFQFLTVRLDIDPWWKGDNCRSENVVRSLWKGSGANASRQRSYANMASWGYGSEQSLAKGTILAKAHILNGSIFTVDSRRYKHLHLDNWQQFNQLPVLIGGRHHWAATPTERCITSMWRCLGSTELHKTRNHPMVEIDGLSLVIRLVRR